MKAERTPNSRRKDEPPRTWFNIVNWKPEAVEALKRIIESRKDLVAKFSDEKIDKSGKLYPIVRLTGNFTGLFDEVAKTTNDPKYYTREK